jgi:5-methyltetrahydrofolate corrinoid/iron sulfur protein methyltransferase
MLIIGERINSSRKSIARAIEERDKNFIMKEAKFQAEAGADLIDVNAGAFADQEAEHLKWMIEAVQEATETPLCIDSPDPEVIRSVFPFVEKAPMINSITLDPFRLEGILPIAIEKNAKVIGLCQSEDSMAETTEEKVAMAGQLVKKAIEAGLSLDDLYIDPLVYPLGANWMAAVATLDAIEQIRKNFPDVHTTCGLTNLSFGMPNRRLINRTFLVSALTRGLDSAILDPTDKQLYAALMTTLMVMGKDDFCMQFIRAFREGRLE